MGLFDSLGSMLGLGSAAASSAASLAGGIFGGAASLVGGLMTNSANAANNQNAYNDNMQMADTTYQRTMSDMTAAGLNPILAYSQQLPTATMGVPVVNNVLGQASNSGFDAFSSMMNAGASAQSQTIKQPEADTSDVVHKAFKHVSDKLNNADGGTSAKDQSDPSSRPPPLTGTTGQFNIAPGGFSTPAPTMYDDFVM